ncbi:MAG: 1-acyl-sn-glycerol-3-phosphate acyltransferase [Deltaproteobacteria bacterium]|nr:1-acyl-sn-glycerol-3-phosphate acyltransferase [Deltaproteobacteria bacterium]
MTRAPMLLTILDRIFQGKSLVAVHSQKGWLLRRVVRPDARWGADPLSYDPGVAERTVRWLGLLFGKRRWFRLDPRGFERMPPSPALLVSNHSGGTTVLDAWGLFMCWYRHFGFERPLHPVAHELLLSTEATGRFFATRGVLHAQPEVALAALLEHRRDVLVMPGGDLDTWRPFKDRYRVQFAGRTGYARLAIKAGVPIVPVAHAGAHHTLVVLTDGRKIAEKLRIQKIARARIWPIHLALPWGLALGPWPHLPLPVTLRYRVGKPIWPKGAKGGARKGEPRDDEVRSLDLRVRSAMQGLLDQLADGN